MHTGFFIYHLAPDTQAFNMLSRAVELEDITTGRKGNHLVDVTEHGVPIVRTTTRYTRAAHCFSSEHHDIVQRIQQAASQDIEVDNRLAFNNALIEIYDRAYVKMGYHSDQALDLAAHSYIALYSCYEHPESRSGLRTLKIKDKTTNKETSLVLEHNTVVLFSMATNTQYLHKIVLEPRPCAPYTKPDNRWLGITFRQSKTHIQFIHDQPHFIDGTALMLADESQRKAFYKLRGQENRSMDFEYPRINYTISAADTLNPK